MRVLFEEGAGDNQGGGAVETPPAFTPQHVTSVQVDSLRSKQASPVQIQDKPIPDSIKGTQFDLGDDNSVGDFPDNKEAAPRTDFSITKTENKSNEQKDATKQPEKAVEQQQKKETPPAKDADKSVEQQQPAKPPVTPAKKEVESRDYSVFPEEIRDELKKTSNGAFNYIKDVYTKHKALEEDHSRVKAEVEKIEKGGLPFSYYQNPEAWRLHPHGSQLLSQAGTIEWEESYNREQLQKIQAGEKFKPLRGYDKQGNPVFWPEQEPSEQAKTDIMLAIGQLANAKVNAYTQVNTFAQRFQGEMQQQAQKVNEIIDSEFPWHKDPNDEHQQWVKEFSGVVPEERENDYMSRIASYLYAKYQKALSLLEESAGYKKAEEAVAETKRAIEPSVKSGSIAGAQRSGVNAGNSKFQPPAKFDLEGMT